MAGWSDMISLFLTVSIFGGIVYVILLVVQSVSQGVESAKEGLKTKGVHITDKGVAVKTSKRFDREDYVDATQRGIVKAVGASSYGKRSESGDHLSPPAMASRSSSASSADDKKHRNPFKRSSSSNAKD
ncbi:hypothetical protein R3P38DRAFT_2828380 [Favolaschia claudopus]|uniref:Uncharacterized protein n=1 Tax=Favolaschia claudopus TaxID=2862362 RepID=A0AAW0E7K2_9AGAR